MTGSEYQKFAMRTNDEKSTERLALFVNDGRIDIGGILNGCLGLSGEVGEFNDMMKKWIFHEKLLDEGHAKKELGDIFWYLALIAHAFGWNLDEIMLMNVEKLKARYPEGFSTELSNNRRKDDV